MNTEPLVSVIVPTYNEAPLLEIAVRSLMEQSYRNIEILIVDDKSSDDTGAVAERLAQEDPRVRYLLNPHEDPHRVDWRGVNVSVGYLARNLGMDEARGEWLTFQDADDASLLNRIEVQLALARERKATLITTSWMKFEERRVGKKLDVEKAASLGSSPLTPEEVTAAAKRARGILMSDRFPHAIVPFLVQKFLPFVRPLFFGTQEPYPGADNSMFFRREVREKVRFRKLRERQWPSLGGRGVGRDFCFKTAEIFKNSYSFPLPLYLWRQKHENAEIPDPDSLLI